MMYEYSGSNEDVVIENEYLHLRFKPETAEIILTNKITGHQWLSNPPGASDDPLADVITKDLMVSQFALDYADNAGIGMTLYSGIHSVQREAYEYEVIDDVLEVRYTVGDITRAFRIPPAMYEERMLGYLEQMDWGDRQFVESIYRLYDINNLRLNDDRNKLLSDFPELARRKMYVVRSGTPDYMKEEAEGFFMAAGYTYENFYEDSMRYEIPGEVIQPAFSIVLRYILDGRSLLLNIPFDRIGYRQTYPVTQLMLMPFMGSGNINDDGYMFVPDGSGALIYFNNQKQNQLSYSTHIFGWDEALMREAVISDNKAPFPVFGLQKNGAALVCIIEEGISYASIRADVSGRNSSWNRVFPVFTMVHGAKMDISGRSQRDVFLYEANLPEGESITLRYVPCAAPGYMGMAEEYRSWLIKKYPVLENRKMKSGIPVVVEIIGAVNKIQHRMGMPFDLSLKLTSYKETEAKINDFAELGWKNVHIILNGWFNRSVEHEVPFKIKLIKELGSKKDFKGIRNAADKNNFLLYPEVDFVFVRDVKAFSGFNLNRDAARFISRNRVQRYPYSFVWFGERKLWGKLNYLARPETVNRMIDTFLKKASSLGINNITFRNMGSRLGGDYHERRLISREAAMNKRKQKFEQLYLSGTEMIVKTGFSYSVPWASVITDIATSDQGFGITDTAVPFYQIVLSGLVPYTGKAINLAEDYTMNLLYTIESGAGLYFSFMKEETAVLQETKFRQFYANEYDKWIGDADALYKKFTADFGHLTGLSIIDHVILTPGFTITEYEDGTKIIVNKTNNLQNYNGNVIGSNDYIVLKQRLGE